MTSHLTEAARPVEDSVLTEVARPVGEPIRPRRSTLNGVGRLGDIHRVGLCR